MEILSTRKLYSNPFTICIEGNIGSGKTTFLNHFRSFNATILEEPVDLWRNVAEVNLLVSFTNNCEAYLCNMEITVKERHV